MYSRLDSHDGVARSFALGPPSTVRLPAPKTSQPVSMKSKGYPFLEFGDNKALQGALQLHHSELEGWN